MLQSASLRSVFRVPTFVAMSRGCILVADDNAVVHAALKEAAEARGYRVIGVNTGVGAIVMAIAARPDLIVLDIQFPDADGRDVLAKLKADERTAHIPVVVWSGRQGHDSDRRISLELGAEDYVEKNEADRLVSKIERVLQRVKQSEPKRSA
jgi:CheY-like chemotaxis protein